MGSPSWQTIDATNFKHDYIDASGNDLRSYGASVVVCNELERYAILPDARHLPFVKYFGICFLLFWCVIAYLFIPGDEKWVFIFLGPLCGGFAFSVIYLLLAQEIKNGPYFEFYPDIGVVKLPRYGVEYNQRDLECLQWITGGSKNHGSDLSTDVNLIVRLKDGKKIRYFLLGSPSRSLALEISAKVQIPVKEIILGTHGKRDEDGRSLS